MNRSPNWLRWSTPRPPPEENSGESAADCCGKLLGGTRNSPPLQAVEPRRVFEQSAIAAFADGFEDWTHYRLRLAEPCRRAGEQAPDLFRFEDADHLFTSTDPGIARAQP